MVTGTSAFRNSRMIHFRHHFEFKFHSLDFGTMVVPGPPGSGGPRSHPGVSMLGDKVWQFCGVGGVRTSAVRPSPPGSFGKFPGPVAGSLMVVPVLDSAPFPSESSLFRLLVVSC